MIYLYDNVGVLVYLQISEKYELVNIASWKLLKQRLEAIIDHIVFQRADAHWNTSFARSIYGSVHSFNDNRAVWIADTYKTTIVDAVS